MSYIRYKFLPHSGYLYYPEVSADAHSRGSGKGGVVRLYRSIVVPTALKLFRYGGPLRTMIGSSV